MKKTKLPEYFRGYFWDVDFDRLGKSSHYYLIIKRTLDRGDTKSIRWLVKNYGIEKIKEVLLITKDLSRVSGCFWADMLSVGYEKFPCLQKPYSPIHFGLYS